VISVAVVGFSYSFSGRRPVLVIVIDARRNEACGAPVDHHGNESLPGARALALCIEYECRFVEYEYEKRRYGETGATDQRFTLR